MESKLVLTYTPDKKDYVKASRALAKKTILFIIGADPHTAFQGV